MKKYKTNKKWKQYNFKFILFHRNFFFSFVSFNFSIILFIYLSDSYILYTYIYHSSARKICYRNWNQDIIMKFKKKIQFSSFFRISFLLKNFSCANKKQPKWNNSAKRMHQNISSFLRVHTHSDTYLLSYYNIPSIQTWKMCII